MIEKRVKDKANEVLHTILCQIKEPLVNGGSIEHLDTLTMAVQRLTYLANIEQEDN